MIKERVNIYRTNDYYSTVKASFIIITPRHFLNVWYRMYVYQNEVCLSLAPIIYFIKIFCHARIFWNTWSNLTGSNLCLLLDISVGLKIMIHLIWEKFGPKRGKKTLGTDSDLWIWPKPACRHTYISTFEKPTNNIMTLTL